MSSNSRNTQLAQLFATRHKQLYVAALAITRDRDAAEDVVLDAILAVAELPVSPDNLLAYLFRTVRNKALHLSKQNSRFNTDHDLTGFIDTNSQNAEQNLFTRQILRYLDELDSDQQQVLVMKLFGDLTFDEIAEITASNPNTVASWYRRGLILLKEKIHEPAL